VAGDARPSAAYYVAISFLVVGLVAGLSLFLLLATRPHSNTASVEWELIGGTPCAVGGHATSCFRFDVTNTGGGPVFATCQVTPAPGTQATFDDQTKVKPVSLPVGGIHEMIVSVVADQSADIAPPTMSCSATQA